MSERIGVGAAIVSSAVGGMSAAVTRYVIGATDPITLAAFRFGLGFVFLLPLAFALNSRWPQRKDWLGVASLGVLFYAVFFSVFNLSLKYTTAARGSLALSILPLLTMVVGAAIGVEPLTARKTMGVLVALGGVAIALLAGLADAPSGAWRGDLIMVAGTLCMALYNVWSRPFIARSSPLAFVTAGMGSGAVCVALIAYSTGGFAAAGDFATAHWIAVVYLGMFGGALTFFLWVFALERTTPTRVASTITINPITASVVAAMLIGEPIGLNLVIGIAAVLVGIWVASSDRRVDR
jgi:drug/metabolite transporter (DMT)-like permease